MVQKPMQSKKIYCADVAETEKLAATMARLAGKQFIIGLIGELGAGKTSFARGFLRALGHQGSVKSPTYTVVEPYEGLGELGDIKLFHFDLYRINDITELELMGIRDYFATDALILIEWPENGRDCLPQADLNCYIVPHHQGRMVTITAVSDQGNKVVTKF